MKKNIYKIIAVSLLLATTTACEKTFDELASNPNQQDVNGFYNTPQNINKGVIGIYAYITTPRAMGTAGRLQINRGDESSDCSDYGEPGQYSANLSSSWYTIVQPYALFYTAASQACQMIEAIPNVNFTNQQLKNAYLGEAYFLRAYTHWFLFLNFRNIPLMKELPKSAKDYKPQATPEEAWDFIISDLKRAKELLPEKGFWTGESIGRVTKGSAIALLGKAYLYRSGIERYYGNSTTTYYNEAAAEFNELILSGKYRLVADYNDNFKVATENNDESIFELQFLGDVTNTGFNPGLSNSGVWRDPRGYLPPTNKNASSSVIHDWVYNTFVNSKDASGHTDPRMFGTLIFDDTKPEINARTGDEVRIFDNKTFREYYGAKGFGVAKAQANKYKAACRKGIDWTLSTRNPGNNFYMWNGRANGLNQIEIRYADVLLMYAEAVVNGGTQGSLSALDAVNQVRARVGMPAVASVDMNVIERERILELTQEGHRFFDLLRWGKVVQRFRELEVNDPNFKQYNNSAYLGFQEHKNEWLPLPVDEVEGNPYIQRNNPGW
ncbi:RagB/SusD family nutrient uptake outer membrane protein [Capnocytophaga periodontitidis]|uniref:RagB/SusD family nutrient uptake outer membrane protein n=1 Tax=Capnocytophaga periodontitidis TaxID=2795027 RepID=UPI0018E1461B|nr:RagB/SusD family nutrient uptake outer membrane protein [Capnocytophaga periodontitidis]MBI1667031.1 RagB/SusD family nutrient uptake outer membrane protein [Capnocytophaga periodontitidis]